MDLRKLFLLNLKQNFEENGLKIGRAEDINISVVFDGIEPQKVYYSTPYEPILNNINIYNGFNDLKSWVIDHGGEIIPWEQQINNGSIEPGGSSEPVLQGAKILCKYNINIEDTGNSIDLYHQISGSGSGSGSGEAGPIFSSMKVDGVEQEVANLYTFDTTGEHTVLFTLPEGVTSISANAFQFCYKLTSVTIGNSVTSIGEDAFDSCSGLTSITIPNSVTSISGNAFNGCSGLTSITIPDSVTSIDHSAFYRCSGLTSISVAANNQTYDSRNNCNAIIETSTNTLIYGTKNTIIPNTVTSIGNYAFSRCSGLTNITIPDSVTSIGGNAFQYCSGLTNITCNATNAPTIQYDTFQSIKSGGTLIVPAGSTGYDVWMGTDSYYLGKYDWTKVDA